jgi:hypothetical protein
MTTNNAVNDKYLRAGIDGLSGNVGWNPSTLGINTHNSTSPFPAIVGERVSSSVASGSAISISSNVAKTLTSISLTAGDWDVRGNIWYIAAGTTVINEYLAGISFVDNTLPTESATWSIVNIIMTTGTAGGVPALQTRVNVNATTTVYLIGFSSFTTSTMTMCGRISAVRQR